MSNPEHTIFHIYNHLPVMSNPEHTIFHMTYIITFL